MEGRIDSAHSEEIPRERDYLWIKEFCKYDFEERICKSSLT